MRSNFLSENISFPFHDPHRVTKMAIGSLLILASLVIPLVPLFFVAGYCLRICQRIIHDDGLPHLPEWDDWSWYFRNGFRLSEAGLVYALPGLILLTASYLMVFYPLIANSMFSIITNTPQVLSANAMELIQNGAILMGVATVISLVGGFFSAPAAMHMVSTGSIKAIFHIREWWEILIHAPGKFLGAFALISFASIILLTIFTVLTATLIFCLPAAIIFSIGGIYLSVTASALFASAYRAGALTNQESRSGGNNV